MNLLESVFGTDKTIKQAQEAANDVVSRVEPILLHIGHRAAAILHSLLTRLNGTEITIVVKIPPQPYPDADSEVQPAKPNT